MVVAVYGISRATIRGYKYSDICGVVNSTILHKTYDRTWGDVHFRMPRGILKWGV
jgi:hypothetical protein